MSARSEEKRNLAPCIHDIVNTIRVKRNYRYPVRGNEANEYRTRIHRLPLRRSSCAPPVPPRHQCTAYCDDDYARDCEEPQERSLQSWACETRERRSYLRRRRQCSGGTKQRGGARQVFCRAILHRGVQLRR